MSLASITKMPLFMLLLALGAGSMLSACNTIEGLGQDTQAAGEATSETARDTEEELSD